MKAGARESNGVADRMNDRFLADDAGFQSVLQLAGISLIYLIPHHAYMNEPFSLAFEKVDNGYASRFGHAKPTMSSEIRWLEPTSHDSDVLAGHPIPYRHAGIFVAV